MWRIRPAISPGPTAFSRKVPASSPTIPKFLYDFAWAAYSLGKVKEARRSDAARPGGRPGFEPVERRQVVSGDDGTQPGRRQISVATEAEVEQVLKANPDYVPALMARAAILLQRGESRGCSRQAYSEVLRRFPDFAPAQKRLAALYAEDPEKREQAYDLVMKARKALPDDPELAQILAELSYQRKEFAYAAQLLRRSSEKRPLDAKSLYYLGMSHLKANEKPQSREALRQALAAGLQDPLASDAKAALAELEKE